MTSGAGRGTPLETFVKLPTFVLELACAGVISPSALMLYGVLRSHRNQKKQAAWPSYTLLAQEMGKNSRQNITPLMNQLVESGAIIKDKRSGTSNVYWFPEVPQGTVVAEAEGVIAEDYTYDPFSPF